MHFELLSADRTSKVEIELVRSETIRITRKPTRVFEFHETEDFIDALSGNKAAVIYVGKDSDDSEEWKAYYWQPTYEQARKSFGEGVSLLPYGSMALLHMESEYELKFALEGRTKKAKRWLSLFNQVQNFTHKISRIDRDSDFADSDRFRFMNADDLEKVLEQIKTQYQALTEKGTAEV